MIVHAEADFEIKVGRCGSRVNPQSFLRLLSLFWKFEGGILGIPDCINRHWPMALSHVVLLQDENCTVKYPLLCIGATTWDLIWIE